MSTMAKELDEAKAKVDEQGKDIATLTDENATLKTRVTALEADAATAEAASVKEGAESAVATIKTRAAKYGAEFAIEHIDDTDASIQAAHVTRIEAENAALRLKVASGKGGLDSVGDGGSGPAPKTEAQVRKELIESGMGAREAAMKAKEVVSGK